MLDESIRCAEERGLTDLRATTLHDRAHVACQRRRFDESDRFAFSALKDTRDDSARDRLPGDIAACVAELGLRSAARDAYLVIAVTAQELRGPGTAAVRPLARGEGFTAARNGAGGNTRAQSAGTPCDRCGETAGVGE
jgi:hypothetical protein